MARVDTREFVHTAGDLRFEAADPAKARTLTAAQVDAYNLDGYLSPLPVLGADEAAELRSYFDDLLESVVGAPDRRNTYSINTYHVVCQRQFDLVMDSRLLDYVEDILGPDFVCWSTHLLAKKPHDPMEVPLHQDGLFWPFTPLKTVTVWLAIDDVDAENSAMQFVPGSHLLGPLDHEKLELDGSRVISRQVADEASHGPRFDNALRAGECSLHTDLTLHGSPPNASARRRAGYSIRYVSTDVRAAPGYESWLWGAVRCRGDDPAGYWGGRPRPEGENPKAMANFSGIFDGNPPT